MERAERTVQLPISGLEATIREGDGYLDRVLLKRSKRLYQVFAEYLAGMVVRLGEKERVTAKDILDLLSPDAEYLAIECYRLNYGDVFEFDLSCPQCNQSHEYALNLETLSVRPLGDGLSGPDPTISGVLPRSGRTVVVGMLTGHKEGILIDLAATGSLDLSQASYQAIRSLDGNHNPTYEEIIALPLADHKSIRKLRRQLICGYDTTVSVDCEACGERITFNLLLHKDFLLPAG